MRKYIHNCLFQIKLRFGRTHTIQTDNKYGKAVCRADTLGETECNGCKSAVPSSGSGPTYLGRNIKVCDSKIGPYKSVIKVLCSWSKLKLEVRWDTHHMRQQQSWKGSVRDVGAVTAEKRRISSTRPNQLNSLTL